MKSIHTTLAIALLAVATTAQAAESAPTRTDVKKQTLMAICLGETTAVGDSGKTWREEYPEMYKHRMAMCNKWIATMPSEEQLADTSKAPLPK